MSTTKKATPKLTPTQLAEQVHSLTPAKQAVYHRKQAKLATAPAEPAAPKKRKKKAKAAKGPKK